MDPMPVSMADPARGSGTTVTVAVAVFVASGCRKGRSNFPRAGGAVTGRLVPPRHDLDMRLELMIVCQICSLGRNQERKQLLNHRIPQLWSGLLP